MSIAAIADFLNHLLPPLDPFMFSEHGLFIPRYEVRPTLFGSDEDHLFYSYKGLFVPIRGVLPTVISPREPEVSADFDTEKLVEEVRVTAEILSGSHREAEKEKAKCLHREEKKAKKVERRALNEKFREVNLLTPKEFYLRVREILEDESPLSSRVLANFLKTLPVRDVSKGRFDHFSLHEQKGEIAKGLTETLFRTVRAQAESGDLIDLTGRLFYLPAVGPEGEDSTPTEREVLSQHVVCKVQSPNTKGVCVRVALYLAFSGPIGVSNVQTYIRQSDAYVAVRRGKIPTIFSSSGIETARTECNLLVLVLNVDVGSRKLFSAERLQARAEGICDRIKSGLPFPDPDGAPATEKEKTKLAISDDGTPFSKVPKYGPQELFYLPRNAGGDPAGGRSYLPKRKHLEIATCYPCPPVVRVSSQFATVVGMKEKTKVENLKGLLDAEYDFWMGEEVLCEFD